MTEEDGFQKKGRMKVTTVQKLKEVQPEHKIHVEKVVQ